MYFARWCCEVGSSFVVGRRGLVWDLRILWGLSKRVVLLCGWGILLYGVLMAGGAL